MLHAGHARDLVEVAVAFVASGYYHVPDTDRLKSRNPIVSRGTRGKLSTQLNVPETSLMDSTLHVPVLTPIIYLILDRARHRRDRV